MAGGQPRQTRRRAVEVARPGRSAHRQRGAAAGTDPGARARPRRLGARARERERRRATPRPRGGAPEAARGHRAGRGRPERGRAGRGRAGRGPPARVHEAHRQPAESRGVRRGGAPEPARAARSHREPRLPPAGQGHRQRPADRLRREAARRHDRAGSEVRSRSRPRWGQRSARLRRRCTAGGVRAQARRARQGARRQGVLVRSRSQPVVRADVRPDRGRPGRAARAPELQLREVRASSTGSTSSRRSSSGRPSG